MTSTILSTNEVASMVRVTETTVKRWADEGKLPCAKTLGGHRKFKMKDIVEFAEQYGYPLAGTQPPPLDAVQQEQLEVGVITRNYRKIADIILQKALQGDNNGVLELLHYLYKHHISLGSIADEIIRPALVLIGELWREGKLEINQEHLASEAVRESLIRFAPEIHHKTSNGLTALCACPENEFHEIGLRSFSYVLEGEGWKIYFLGANTPFDTLRSFITTMKPDAVCLSVTLTERKKEFFDGMKSIAEVTHSYQGKYLVGSYHTGIFKEDDFNCDCLTGSAVDAVAYLKDVFNLKPGPKKSVEINHAQV